MPYTKVPRYKYIVDAVKTIGGCRRRQTTLC